MEVYQLEYFKVISECASLTEAADRLHVSQPSLSRCVRKMEEEVGVPLFDRVGRNLILNGAGEVVLRCASAALDTIDAIVPEVGDYLRDRAQTVNLFAPMPLADDGMALVSFKRKYPDVLVRVGVGWLTGSFAAEVPDLVLYTSNERPAKPNAIALYEEYVALAVPRDHSLANRKSVRLSDLGDERFVQPLPCEFADLTHEMFAEAGIKPHIVVEDQSQKQVVNFVKHGIGVALVPPYTWHSKEDEVAVIPFSDVRRSRFLCLRWQENTVLPYAVLALRDHLIEHYRAMSDELGSF